MDDENRHELLWEDREEVVIRRWLTDTLKRSEYHGAKGKKLKSIYNALGIPCFILPLIMSSLTGLHDWSPIVYSLMLVVLAILNGFMTVLNLGKKSEAHLQYENMFHEFYINAEAELSKPKRDRIACDVYISETKNRYTGLISGAPT